MPHLLDCLLGKLVEHRMHLDHRLLVPRAIHTSNSMPHDVCHADPIGAQDPRIRMVQNLFDPQLFRDRAGVLRRRSAKRDQQVVTGVIAARHRNGANRSGHVSIGHLQKTPSHFVQFPTASGRRSNRIPYTAQTLSDRRPIQRKGKLLGQDLAGKQVKIGHRQRTTSPVTSGTWLGSRTIRANNQLHAIKLTDRSAAGCHRFDCHHRCHHTDTRFLRLVLQFEASVEPSHIGAGPTHVEADRSLIASRGRDF